MPRSSLFAVGGSSSFNAILGSKSGGGAGFTITCELLELYQNKSKKPVADLAGAVKIRMYLKIVARFLPLAAARAGTDSPFILRSRISVKELASESGDFGAWLACGFFPARVPFGSVPFTIFWGSLTF